MLNTSAIPSELLALPQFVLWKYETRAGEEKPTKVLYNPNIPTRRAKSNDSATWGSLEQVQAVLTRQPAAFTGIGFVVTEQDPFVGLDLDHCINTDTGELTPFAEGVVSRMASYTEITPSGNGLRVWVKGKLPGTKRRNADIEMYETGRFFTLTGKQFGTCTNIVDRPEELNKFYYELFPVDTTPPKRTTAAPPVTLSERDLLEKIRTSKNGDKFTALFDQGAGSGDKSGADMSLCNILSFWCGCDTGLMDSLFRQSALMRDKWDERRRGDGATYGKMTIENAVNHCRETYTQDRPRAEVSYPDAPEELHAVEEYEPYEPSEETGIVLPDVEDIVIANNRQEWKETDKGSKAVFYAHRLGEIYQQIFDVTDGWPKRINTTLFYDRDGEIQFFDRVHDLFAWVADYAPLSWKVGMSEDNLTFPPQEQLFSYAATHAPLYEDIANLPHEPALKGHYYAWKPLQSYIPDGTHLNHLIKMFANVDTEGDIALIRAMFMTPCWGGDFGQRPIFAIVAPDRGCGKSTLSEAVGTLYGGLIDMNLGKRAEEEIIQRLLTPSSRLQRIVRLDNIKGEVNSAILEGLISTKYVSGKQMYKGDARRPNTLTYILTGNGMRLDGDMAERCFIIRLTKPKYNPTWQHTVSEFITKYQQFIIMDIIEELKRTVPPTGAEDRWMPFVDGVLSHCCEDTCAVVALNRSRRAKCNEDLEEAETLLEELKRLPGEYVNSGWYFIPNSVVVNTYNNVLNVRYATRTVLATMRLHIEAGHMQGHIKEHHGRSGRGFVVWHEQNDLNI